MRSDKAAVLLVVLLPAFALAKPKKTDVPAIFRNATYVYVESPDGDVMRPGLYPADRNAIEDVEDALRDWNRYTLTTRRDQAEIVIVVRKGRLTSGQLNGRVPVGQPLPSNPAPGHGPGSAGNGPGYGTEAEVGPEDDMLRVYLLDPDGKLGGPIWNRTLTDGLDEPQLLLFQQLKSAVERAYPLTTASHQSKP
jgi:hypothetical protein